MEADVLDDELLFNGFNEPTTFYIDGEDWLLYCRATENKTILKACFIIAGLTIFLLPFFGTILFYILAVLIVFVIIRLRQKFKRMRLMANHYFIIDNTKIEYHSKSFQRTYYFSSLRDISFLTWGIELEVKNRRGPEKFLMIPRMIEGFGQIEALFRRLNE